MFLGGGRGIRSCLLQSNLGQQFLCFAKAFGQPLKTTHRVVFLTLSFESLLLSTEKQNEQAKNACSFCWRRKRDSNPRGLSPKRFSRPPRYDRFDIPPLCMPGKNNTNRGQDAVFLTNTALRSRLRHKVLTRSRALSLPENTASDSQATKPPIFPMIFGKNERSCTLSVLQASFCQKARKLRRFGKACITLAWHIG